MNKIILLVSLIFVLVLVALYTKKEGFRIFRTNPNIVRNSPYSYSYRPDLARGRTNFKRPHPYRPYYYRYRQPRPFYYNLFYPFGYYDYDYCDDDFCYHY